MTKPVDDIRFTLGTFTATSEMRELIDGVLSTGRLSYGPLCREFEKGFARAHGRDFGCLSNSGTSSLQVALQAMKELYGWADGDEVIIPATTFVATANIVYHCKMIPVLVDVDPLYYAIDPSLIRDKITSRTRAIIPVHPFGQGADMPAIMDIAQWKGLRVIEDSCEAMFVKVGDKYVGAWGDVGCYSTYVAHIITGGIGGIGITDDVDLAYKMRSLVNHGIDVTQLPIGQVYDPTFLSRHFLFSSIGHSFRVTELEAALLLPQLKQGPDIVNTRRAVAFGIYTRLMRYKEWLELPTIRPGSEHAFMVYPLVLKHQFKEPIMRFLRKHGIECRDLLPLTTQPCYDFDPREYPVSDNLNERGFYIGCHQDLTVDQLDHMGNVFYQWFGD